MVPLEQAQDEVGWVPGSWEQQPTSNLLISLQKAQVWSDDDGDLSSGKDASKKLGAAVPTADNHLHGNSVDSPLKEDAGDV